jgi:hypothetical protein
MIHYQTACGGLINVPHQAQLRLNARPDVLAHLHAAIGQIHLPESPRRIEEEIDMGQIIGRSNFVKTKPLQLRERALFSCRMFRMMPSRVVNSGELGEETSKIVVIARPTRNRNKDDQIQYDLIISWIGIIANTEPWDICIAERADFEECLAFWSTTALVYEPDIMGPVVECSFHDILILANSRFL